MPFCVSDEVVLFAFDVESFQKLDRRAFGIFPNFSNGIKAVFVMNAEHGAEREVGPDLFLIDFAAVSGEFGIEIREFDLGKMHEKCFGW